MPKLNKRSYLTVSIVVIAGYLVSRLFIPDLVRSTYDWGDSEEAKFNFRAVVIVVRTFWFLLLAGGLFGKDLFRALGMQRSFMQGLAVALISTLPMIVGYAIYAEGVLVWDAKLLFRDMFMAGFYEELVFRAFTFGLLFQYGGWGFIPAAIVPSLLFALGHLYQGGSGTEILQIFLFVGLSSIGLSWFYSVWKNLWVLALLHGLMDLSWSVFQIDANVLGTGASNLFRFSTIGIMIGLTIWYGIRNKQISLKGKLWVNK